MRARSITSHGPVTSSGLPAIRSAFILGVALFSAACGGATSEAPASAEPGAASRDETATRDADTNGETALIGCVGDGCAGVFAALSDPPPPRPSPAPLLRPEGSEIAAGDTSRPPPIAIATAHYAQLSVLPIGSEQPTASAEALVDMLRAHIDDAAQRVRQLDGACAEAVHGDASLATACDELMADARDLLARNIDHADIAVPTDITQRIESMDEETRGEVERLVLERVRAVLGVRAVDVWCFAATLYGRAGTHRSAAQLARYGDAFRESCRSLDPTN